MKRTLPLLFLALCLLLSCLSFTSCSEEKGSLLSSLEADGLTFSARGSFGKVKQIVVKRGDAIIFSCDVGASKDAGKLESSGLRLADLNFDGHSDIILASKVDGECVTDLCFLYNADADTFAASDELSGLCNVIADREREAVFTFAHIRTTDRAYADVPKTYTETDRATMHVWNGAKFVPFRCASVTYYSETDIYCYSVADYNEATGSFDDSDDRWFSPSEYAGQNTGFLYYFR